MTPTIPANETPNIERFKIEVTHVDIQRGSDTTGHGPIESAMRRAGFNFPEVAIENMGFFPPGCGNSGPCLSWEHRHHRIIHNPPEVVEFQERVRAHDPLEPFEFEIEVRTCLKYGRSNMERRKRL